MLTESNNNNNEIYNILKVYLNSITYIDLNKLVIKKYVKTSDFLFLVCLFSVLG